jgi:hypothetical protein
MAVTLEQMAEAYINSIKQQIEQAKGEISKAQEYLIQLENHLVECQQARAPVSVPNSPPKSDESTVHIDLPNPFDAITKSQN